MSSGRQVGVVAGTALTVAMRWADRGIGLLSTLVLARLLVPADFGIVAMGMLVVGLVDSLMGLGVNVALIRNASAEQAHYDTAWTLRLMQMALAALVVVGAAPLAVEYFNEVRVAPVLRLLAIGLLVSGLENIGIVTFQKEMRFGRDFKFLLSRRLIGFVATIAAALLLRSYWALVVGLLVSRVAGVVLSYGMHPMRPRLSLVKVREIFSVSQWMLLRGVAQYLNASLDALLVGRRMDAKSLGGYTLAAEVAAMPSTEILAPLNRVLFPAFVRVKDRPIELRRLYLLAQAVQVMVVAPVAVGVLLVAKEAVSLLLGEKWLFAVPVLKILVIAKIAEAVMTSGLYLLMTLGRVRQSVIPAFLEVGLFAALAIMVLPSTEWEEIAMIRVAVCFAVLGVSLVLVNQALQDLTPVSIMATAIRPAMAVAVMALAVEALPLPMDAPVALALVAKALVGAVAYVGSIVVFWFAAGRPAGAEAYIGALIGAGLRQVRS